MSTAEKVLKSLNLDGLPLFKNNRDDDGVDRLNHRWTVLLLTGISLVLTTKQFIGEPIYCWTPAHFSKDSHDDYTNSYCWIRNTYYLHHDDDIPTESEVKKSDGKYRHITYYQWVPAILLLQALGFYLPYFFWDAFNTRSGIDVHSIVQAGLTFEATEMNEIRDKTLQFMTSQMDRYLRNHKYSQVSSAAETRCAMSVKRCLTRTCCRPCGRRRGNYLICLYIFIKLLYLVNVIGQIFLLDVFLGGSAFSAYGVDVIRGAVNLTTDWPTGNSARFPRVTMCDVKVRRLGNIHRYTVQCVLPINTFNEMFFLFIWFWLVIVAIATLISLVMWGVRFSLPINRRRYVKQHLHFLEKLKERNTMRDRDRKKKAKQFVHHYMNQDGIFILRLVAHNTTTITATEFIGSLWDNFKTKQIADRNGDCII